MRLKCKLSSGTSPILGIVQDGNIHSIFFVFIFVVHTHRKVPASHGNSSLIKGTMLPKNRYYFCFIIENLDKITQLVTFFSTERCSSLRVEGTEYLFESDESYDIFLPSIINPDLKRISMT